MGKRKKNPAHTYIVGIGASAGGLEALRALFGSLKSTPRNMAFVVVQHLAPLHRSRLVELIASTTKLPVEEVRDGMAPAPGVICITPPNANLISQGGRLRLRGTELGPKPSVDTFFRSLASDIGPRAVGIVLSGTGSDGALGIQAIRAAGGITFAQSAQSAKYDSMPKAAIQTGAVDAALAPEEIAKELLHISGHRPGKAPRRLAPAGSDPYEAIMRILERQVGVDFFRYKQATIRRRLERRLMATGCATLQDYARYLEHTPGEAQSLVQNILISVTSFFRDAEAFKALAQHVQQRMRAKRDAAPFRAWVVGCASGEEAFSLAILLSEAVERSKLNVRLQIFATDLDEHALAIARRATYPAQSLVGVPKKLIDKYFHPLDDGNYQVRTSLRDAIVFAKHDATEDPPFLSLDLVSCRNVLIYFGMPLQAQLFKTFEYALGKGGFLFLGKSEAVPQDSTAFRLIGRRQKIFERLGTRSEVPHKTPRRDASRESAFISRAKEVGQALDLVSSVVTGLAPDSIIIDSELYIKHVFGAAGEYLVHPPGQATQNLSKLVPAALGAELVALVHKAEKTGRSATGRRHELKLKNQPRIVQLTAVPLTSAASRDFLLSFQSLEAEPAKGKRAGRVAEGMSAEQRAAHLQVELNEVREQLQTVLEEHETTNEEMQSLNEELQSTNEELQSSNEELETTNEELQSSNEELTTVNEELNVKTTEMQSVNQRLHAIQNAIAYPLLIVDRAKKLLNFNPAARQLLRLSDADLGQDVRVSGTLGDMRELIRLVDQAFAKKSEPRLQLEIGERSFEVQIQLFRDIKGAVEGAVASFVENTEIVRALADTRLHRERLSSILEATPAIVTMKDLSGVYLYANRRFSDMLGATIEAIVGRTDEELFGKEPGAGLHERDLDVVRRKKALEVVESYGLGGAGRTWSSSKFPLFDAKKRVQSVCTIGLDMTERLRDQRTIERQQEELGRVTRYSTLTEIAAGIAHEVNTPLSVILAKAEILKARAGNGGLAAAEAVAIANDVSKMAKSVSEIVDGLASAVAHKSNRLEKTCLRQIVHDAARLCEPRVHRVSAELRLELPKDETPVECYPVQIMQIVVNLLNNAVDAVAERRERWIKVRLRATEREALVEVSDSGPGISSSVAEKIFTPFFTTKKDREGTGIGLSLSRSIARRHYGELVLDAGAAETCFRLTLPRRSPDRRVVVLKDKETPLLPSATAGVRHPGEGEAERAS
jgi:two-component system, chemotaxis family, CheB/CheR fusion protein